MRSAALSCCLAPLIASCSGGPVPADGGEGYVLTGTSAELYQEHLVPPLFQPWALDLVARVDPRPGERVLDVACGTGVVARVAAECVGPEGTVSALDISPGMLAVARAIPSEHPIDWREGDALDLPWPEGSFDVVVCQEAVQFFPDGARAVREMHRVLAPGGRVALAVWRGIEHNPYGAAVAWAVARHVGAEAARETRSPFVERVGAELAAVLSEAGFRDVRAEAVALDMQVASLEHFVRVDLAAYPLTGAAIAGWSEERRRTLVDAAVAHLGPYRAAEGWTIPFQAHVAVGVK